MRIIVFIALILLSKHLLAKELIPAEAFSQLPFATDVTISPNGKSLAFLQNLDGYTILVSVDLETNKTTPIVRTNNKKYKITWMNWANNDRIVFGAFYPDRRYGTETSETRLMVATKGEPGATWLIRPRSSVKGTSEHPAQYQDNVIDWLPNDPSHILISVDFDKQVYDSVFKVNVNTKSRKRIQRPRKDVISWNTDQQGRVRIGNAYDNDTGRSHYRVLDIEKNTWHTLWDRDALLDAPFTPLGFGLNPHILYLRADHNGRGAIFTIDTRLPEKTPLLKSSDPNYDIDGSLIYSTKTHDVIGVFHHGSKGGRIYWDPIYQALQTGLDKALPQTDNQLVSLSRKEDRYILFSSSDNNPGTYFLGDRTTKQLNPIINIYPNLPLEKLTRKQHINLTMRDGLKIEAYLSLPLGISTSQASNLPAIIFPHGGPISRDYGNFDYWSQFFTSRGIAVLQPNFRGSAGYGHAFKLEALGNYGLKMQDDLTDATQWLIQQGIADPKRICIVGASYGGYAALTATFKTPDLFRCAISFAGISDLAAQKNKSRKFLNYETAKKQYGNNSEILKQNSAYYHAEEIKAPILLLHGEYDRVVPPSQSSKMANALNDHDKIFRHIELKDGTHYLLNQKNRSITFNEMDKFLEKYLLNSH